MKKFWEKHDLLKAAGIMTLLSVLLTWVIKQGYYDGTELVVGEITRVGIFDFFNYGLLGLFYFTVVVTFLFVVGAFYQVLSKTSGYQNLTSSIAKKFKGKEILFVLLTSFIIAALSAVMTEYYIIIVFIPFILSIMSRMKLDKITGFVTTFGSILIGFIGSIYNTNIAGVTISTFGVATKDVIWYKVGIFVFTYIIFNLFTILNMKKSKTDKSAEPIEELFDVAPVSKKVKTWPMAVIFGIFVLISILAYLPWETFGDKFFANITENILNVQLAEKYNIFSYILGTVSPFGKWDLFGIQILMLMVILVVKWTYKISFDDLLTSLGEGIRKVVKLVIVLLAAFLIVEFAIMYPVLPTIFDWIMNLTSKFNSVLGTLGSLITSLFTTEYTYTTNLIGSYLAGTYSAIVKPVSIMLQTTFGIASLIAPSSAILLVGLSYLGINYKSWFKYIWKFLVIMLVATIVLVQIMI